MRIVLEGLRREVSIAELEGINQNLSVGRRSSWSGQDALGGRYGSGGNV
jgi:hypothetical protein